MIKKYWLYKMVLLYALFLYCQIPVCTNDQGAETELVTGSFKFAFIMLENGQPVSITDTNITTEMLKNEVILYYKPVSDAYVYLYALSPKREFRLIRPNSFNDLNKYSYFYKSEYIYFTTVDELLPESGCWEIHLIISTTRLPEVERLMIEMGCLKPGKQNSLIILTNKLNSEIQSLKVKTILGSNPVELPEPINSPFRMNDDIKSWLDKNTTAISFINFYESVYKYECEKKD